MEYLKNAILNLSLVKHNFAVLNEMVLLLTFSVTEENKYTAVFRKTFTCYQSLNLNYHFSTDSWD